MQPLPEPHTNECSTCHAPLNSVGDCLSCRLRNDLEETVWETASSKPAAPVFGDFEIARREDGSLWELGRGAMGVTYRALDRVLHRNVALKVVNVPAEAGNVPVVRERFLREARAAAALRHANVAGIFQLGASTDSGRCYCAMELVEGETLEARVRRDGPLDVETALEMAIQIARALTAAMTRGLVHRDLKPSNLMLSGHSAAAKDLEVKVIDFGLAKMAAASAGERDLTQGGFIGTPAFASPEQFEDGEVDARSDMYSLGVTLWFALTGSAPFTGKSLEELRAAQVRGVLPFEQLADRNVPAPVIALLRSVLAVNPAKRPATARELLAALEGCCQSSNTSSHYTPQATIERPAPTKKRVAGLVAGLAALAAVTIAGIWWVAAHPATASRADKSIAVLPFENLSADKDNAFFTDGVQDEILTDLAKIADLKVISRTSVMQYKGDAARNLREIAAQLGVTHIVEGNVQRMGNRVRVTARLIDARTDVHQWAEHYDRPLDDVFAIQNEIAQAIADQLRARISPAEHDAMSQAPTNDVLAFQLFQQAEDLESREADPDAREGLLQAVSLLGAGHRARPAISVSLLSAQPGPSRSVLGGFRPHQPKARLGPCRLGTSDARPSRRGRNACCRRELLLQGLSRLRPRAGRTDARPASPSPTTRMCSGCSPTSTAARAARTRRFASLGKRSISTRAISARSSKRGLLMKDYGATQEAVGFYHRALAILPSDVFTREELALVSYYERADLRPLHALNAAILASEPAAVEGSAYFRLYGALAERNAEAAKAALATFPAEGFAETTNFFMPKEWFAGLTARTFGDAEGARAAFATARLTVEKTVREQPDYAEAWSGLGLIDAGLARKEGSPARRPPRLRIASCKQRCVRRSGGGGESGGNLRLDRRERPCCAAGGIDCPDERQHVFYRGKLRAVEVRSRMGPVARRAAFRCGRCVLGSEDPPVRQCPRRAAAL